MKSIKKFYLILIIVLLSILSLFVVYKGYKYFRFQKIANAPIKELIEEEKLEDFEYLYNVIIENYPFLEVNKRKYGVDWVANKEKYIELIKTNPNFEEVLNIILSDLNNLHTYLLDRNDIIATKEMYKKIKGKKSKFFLDILQYPLVVNRYNIDENSFIETENTNNFNNIENAVVGDIVEGKIASIYIPQMLNSYAMENDKKLIEEYLQKVKDYQALVIDIRGNGGGDTYYWTEFLLPKILEEEKSINFYMFFKDSEFVIDYLKTRVRGYNPRKHKVEELDIETLPNLPPEVLTDFKYYMLGTTKIVPSKDSIKFKGNIYLLVDRYVYSASEAFTNFVKEKKIATIIGSQTGGDGIGINPVKKMLPNSGYVFNYPVVLGTTSDGTVNEEFSTTPDYEVNAVKYKEEYIKADDCIKKVLELENISLKELE